MNTKSLRLKLAQWLWPKEVTQGELFTITRHLRNGSPTQDGSWVGRTLRADKVQGDTIFFSERLDFQSTGITWDRCHTVPLIPGKNCEVKLVATSLTKQEEDALYNAAKANA